MSQELLQRAMQLKQESEEAEQQIEFVKSQIVELEEFANGLREFGKSKKTEILAPLGKGVFVEAELKDSGKLLVDVGAEVIIKKSSEETLKIIESQIWKFREAQILLGHQMEGYALEFKKMLEEIEEMKKGNTTKNKKDSS